MNEVSTMRRAGSSCRENVSDLDVPVRPPQHQQPTRLAARNRHDAYATELNQFLLAVRVKRARAPAVVGERHGIRRVGDREVGRRVAHFIDQLLLPRALVGALWQRHAGRRTTSTSTPLGSLLLVDCHRAEVRVESKLARELAEGAIERPLAA
jgi:hypothetical protein